MANVPESHVAPSAGSLLAKLLPELAVIGSVIWLMLKPSLWGEGPNLNDFDALQYVVMADAGTLMMSGTLIDIASRIKKAPPWWLLPIAIIGILLLYPEAFQLLQRGWQSGFWIFLPFAWSIFERVREIWTLPSAARLEKIRRRVLTFDRLYNGLVVLGLSTVLALGALFIAGVDINDLVTNESLLWPVLAFYVLNAFNVVRVHRARFSQSPRSLWPKFDGGSAADLSEFRL